MSDSDNSNEWFVRRGKTVRGPISSAKIRHYLIEEQLKLDDEVSIDGKDWRSISQVPEVVPLQFRRDKDQGDDDFQDAEERDKTRAIRSMLIVFAVVVSVVIAALWIDRGDKKAAGDCDLLAGPAVNWENCRMNRLVLQRRNLRGAILVNGAFSAAQLMETDLHAANLNYADFSKANLSYSNLTQASLKGTNLRGADLTNADLSSADLSFADLTGARIGGAEFSKVKTDSTRWTDGVLCSQRQCP